MSVSRLLRFIRTVTEYTKVTMARIGNSIAKRFVKAKSVLALKSCVRRQIKLYGGKTYMGKVFKGQSSLRITINTFCDLEGLANAVIRFRKPCGFTGAFEAVPEKAAQGVLSYECADGDIDVCGWWSFWAFVTFCDGRTAAGEAARVYVWDEG
jgi:hypothetical protein